MRSREMLSFEKLYRYRTKSVSLFGVKKARRPKLLDPVKLGRRRWKGVSKEERTRIARKAVEVRWAKVRQAQDATKPAGSKGGSDENDS